VSSLTPDAALAELLEGNRRFVTGEVEHRNQDAARRSAVAGSQAPFAVVFGCSDSRLAAEIIFDRGLGDLFVVRTAGHAIGRQVLGSIEYAVTVLATPLVVVLGHNSCGAVTAARDAAEGAAPAGNVAAIVEALAPSVRLAAERGRHEVDEIVDVHIAETVARLQTDSEAIAGAVAEGRCTVVGMSYDLADGTTRTVTA
jgi:carbonic anhydrase